jgi:transcriptional regulator with XRE-family HTH domain
MPYQPTDSSGLEETMQRFGAELRRCRYNAALTQDELAERSGVAQSTISRLERGLIPHAAMLKIVLIGNALERKFPLGYCPHEHHCAWDRLDPEGRPIERPTTLAERAFMRSIETFRE